MHLRRLKSLYPAFLFVASFLALAYYAAVLKHFLKADDYEVIYNPMDAALRNSVAIGAGRPLYCLALEAIGWCARNHFRHSGLYRLLSLGFLALASFSLLELLLLYRFPRWMACAFVAMFASLPAIIVYEGWLSCGPYLIAVWLAIMAFIRAHRAARLPARRCWMPASVSICLLILSLSIYQPAAMVFFALLALDILYSPAKSIGRAARIGAMKTFIGGVAMGVYFAAFKLAVLMTSVPMQNRERISSDVVDGFCGIVGKIVWTSYNSFNIAPWSRRRYFYQLSILCFVLILAWQHRKALGAFLLKLVSVAGLVLLTSLPLLASFSSWIPFRTMLGPALVFLFVHFYAFRTLAPLVRARFGRASWALAALALIWLVSNDWRLLNDYLIFPSRIEMSYMGKRLGEAAAVGGVAYVIRAENTFIPGAKSDEFGQYTSSIDWALDSMVKTIIREYHVDTTRLKVIPILTPPARLPSDPNTITIDMRDLKYVSFR
ncbi:MAG: glucosyltransferase domain-containing protein [Candidatus Sumerlaeia bacterium]